MYCTLLPSISQTSARTSLPVNSGDRWLSIVLQSFLPDPKTGTEPWNLGFQSSVNNSNRLIRYRPITITSFRPIHSHRQRHGHDVHRESSGLVVGNAATAHAAAAAVGRRSHCRCDCERAAFPMKRSTMGKSTRYILMFNISYDSKV